MYTEKRTDDNRTVSIWYDKEYRPFVVSHTGAAGLLLDDFKCHRSPQLLQFMKDDNAMRYMIPLHNTSILETCDVGINKLLNERLKKYISDWRSAQHALLSNSDKIPVPKREDILGWLKNISKSFHVKY